MMTLVGRRWMGTAALTLAAAGVAFAQPQRSAAASESQQKALPDRLTDQEFWKLIDSVSEPNGFFRSDNLLSNETGFQWVIPPLLKSPRAGKVYLGVGPEQNFTYIAAIKPKMAIIFDIRRGNLHEHMLYKALFELSKDRADFVSRLFGKPRPAGLDTTTSGDSIMNAYWGIDGDSAYFVQQKAAVRDLLATKHHFGLTNDDWAGIWYVWDMFYSWGLPITYNSSSNGGGFGGRGGGMPDYYTLMTATDGAGVNRSYLANEANWRVLKDLEVKNLLVPVVGDFGGPSAIRRVSGWLKERNATVTALYASNVEQYLWQDGKAYAYYDNVAQLPIDSTTVWIRSNGSALGRGFGGGGAGGMRSPNLLCPVQQLLDANKAGQIYSYQSIFNYCY